MQKKGNLYGSHRVIEPGGTLPQSAVKVNNDFSDIYSNEILCDVSTLNIDAASFAVIKERANDDKKEIANIMFHIVEQFGKHQNPWTGSGGMFIGTVSRIGDELKDKVDLKEGDRIASLVSLSLTPLQIKEIIEIHAEKDQVDIKGKAVLFESGLWVKLPKDLPEILSLAVLDVAGAPAQIRRLVKEDDTVAIVGGGGKAGLLCCYEAKKCAGADGRIIAIDYRDEGRKELESAPFIDDVIIAAADQPLALWEKVDNLTGGNLCDVVVSCVSGDNCEMGAIMIARQRGKICFFSMSTSFTKAALGAEGVGKDVEMIIGNGYCEGHAELALNILRESDWLKKLYMNRYC